MSVYVGDHSGLRPFWQRPRPVNRPLGATFDSVNDLFAEISQNLLKY
jgi:hypothetical protein